MEDPALLRSPNPPHPRRSRLRCAVDAPARRRTVAWPAGASFATLAALSLALLAAPSEAAQEPTRAYRLDPSGFVCAWWLQGPTRSEQAGPSPPAPEDGSHPAWRRETTSGASLRLPSARRGGHAQYVHLRSTVELARPLRGYLIAGSRGAGHFSIDGVEVAQTPGDTSRDDVASPVTLAAGAHTLTVRVRVGWAPGRMSLRLLDEQLRPPAGVRVVPTAPGAAAESAPPGPLRMELATSAQVDGFVVTASVELGSTEVSRRLPVEGSLEITTSGPAAGEVPLRSEVAVPPLDVESPAAVLRYPLRLEHDGGLQITARVLASDGEVLGEGSLKRPFRGEQHRLLAQAETLAGQLLGDTSVPQASVWALQAAAEEARQLLDQGDTDWRYRERVLSELVGDLRLALRGRDPLERRRGAMLRAYRSPLDGQLHTYALYVPPGYNPRYAYPLIVGLHGKASTPRLCLRRLFGFDPPREQPRPESERERVRLPNIGALVVCPDGFGDVGYRYPGELDVLRVIAEVSGAYRVDPRRVTVTGPSMGGIGTFALATRYPDRFAGAAALCGQADVRQYREIGGQPLAPWEPWFIERQSPVDWAANGANLPFLVVHGLKDPTPVANSESFVRRYERLGYTVELVTPELGHNVWAETYAEAAVIHRLRKLRRHERPHRVVLVSADYRHRHADWLSIERFIGGRGMGSVRGRTLDRPGRRVRLRTKGVVALSLHLGDRGFPRRGVVKVDVDGQRLELRAGATRFLERAGGREDGAWAEVPGPPALPGHKRPGISGPIDDIRYGPLLFVYGTSDPGQTAINRLRAEEDAHSFWGSAQNYPVLADTELRPSQLRTHHLALYGNPHGNRVLAPLADRLPVRFEPGAVVLGERRFAGPDVGVAFIYPNPDHPDRYILVQAGTTAVGTLHSHHLPRYQPDYLVFDRRVVGRRHRRILQGRAVLAGGFFDERWQLPPAPSTPSPPAIPTPSD